MECTKVYIWHCCQNKS